MSTKTKKKRPAEEMKNLILSTASEIITTEGFENVSIRKIAFKINYSPSIIYHYFRNKEEIINHIMKDGYQKIATAVSSTNLNGLSTQERLMQMTKNYIEEALKMPEEFIAAQLNTSHEALIHTSSLYKGASKDKTALFTLCECLKELYGETKYDEWDIELTAQLIAVSTLGLIIKLIIEKDVEPEQKTKLIHKFCTEIVIQIALGNHNIGKE